MAEIVTQFSRPFEQSHNCINKITKIIKRAKDMFLYHFLFVSFLDFRNDVFLFTVIEYFQKLFSIFSVKTNKLICFVVQSH